MNLYTFENSKSLSQIITFAGTSVFRQLGQYLDQFFISSWHLISKFRAGYPRFNVLPLQQSCILEQSFVQRVPFKGPEITNPGNFRKITKITKTPQQHQLTNNWRTEKIEYALMKEKKIFIIAKVVVHIKKFSELIRSRVFLVKKTIEKYETLPFRASF